MGILALEKKYGAKFIGLRTEPQKLQRCKSVNRPCGGFLFSVERKSKQRDERSRVKNKKKGRNGKVFLDLQLEGPGRK